MEIKETINNFLELILSQSSELKDLGELIAALDELACSVNHIDFKFDENEYVEPPKNNYESIRSRVEQRFPSLGFYNIPIDISEKIGEASLGTGDAIDDITDIVSDLKEVMWCFENTSKADALWHFKFGFKSHWGKHLRELQLYLHDKG